MLSRIVASLPAAASLTALMYSTPSQQERDASEQRGGATPVARPAQALSQRALQQEDDEFGLSKFRRPPVGHVSMHSGFAVELSSF